MKIAVIGGGSTYTPELINGFLARVFTLPVTELWLMDTSAERLSIVGGFAQRMVTARAEPFRVVLTQDQRAAIEGASYVITQLRVGMMAARRGDEYLGKRHGLVGQETTGIGGMAKALRTIPVILQVARDMQEVAAPGALLVNFTNPAGLVTQALAQYMPQVSAVGVCNAAFHTKMEMLAGLELQSGVEIPPDKAFLDTLGLNHLTWYRGLRVGDRDYWPEVMKGFLSGLRKDSTPEWDVNTIETLGMIPNNYLQYYYYTPNKISSQMKWPPSRAEEVMQIEEDLLKQYVEPGRIDPPEDLMKRGGAYYSTVATQLIDSHYNDLGEIHVANVINGDAVPAWPAEWVLELPCKVDASGIHGVAAEPLPLVCFGLLTQVKTYELLTAQAAALGDRKAAYQALLVHPLGPSADQVEAVLNDLLETNRAYLPDYWLQD